MSSSALMAGLTEKPAFSADLKRQAWASVGAPIFALVAVVLVMALGLLRYFATEQDRVFASNSQQLVSNEIQGHITDVRDLSLDWSNWQAAYDNITKSWNPAWVKEIFFTDLVEYVHIARAGETRYSSAAALTPANLQAIDAALSKHFKASALTLDSDQVFHAGNTLFILSTKPVLPAEGSGPIRDQVALIRVLDAAKLKKLGESLGLENLRVAPNAQNLSQRSAAQLHLSGTTLIWDHEHPGSVGFSSLALFVLSWLVLAGVLAWFVARGQVRKQILMASAQQASSESSRLKSQFLFTMSHELRTPLNSIIGYSDILEEDLEKAPEIASPEDARRIRRAADHLLTLINEVLDLSTIESGKFKLNPGPVRIDSILQGVADAVRPLAAKQGTSIAINVEAEIPILAIDGLRLKQCVFNLASNACKFTQSGQVHIRAYLEGNQANRNLCIAVADTGIGIAPENQARLFVPFVQVDGTATRSQEGTGLGLAITKKLAQAMGGDVTLVSTPGLGSTFTLRIEAQSVDENTFQSIPT